MASPILPGLGLGSGLDTGAIVKALVDADKSAKQSQINRQTTTNTSQISGIGTLKSVLANFQTAIKNLGSTTTPQFLGYTATSSDPKVLTSVASNSAVNGTYVIKVDTLATSSKVATAAFAGGPSSAIPSGTLNITQNGISRPVVIPAGATLQSVRDAINTQQGANGFSANIVTDSFGSRLVMGSTVTGLGSDITLSDIPGLEITAGQKMGTTPTATSAGAIGELAADAKFTVDGLAITSKSNTVDGAISGLTLNLVAGGGVTSTVTVGPNSDGLKKSVQAFVDAYNQVVTTVNTLTKPTLDKDGKPTVAAALTGDPLARGILASIREPLASTGAGDKLTVLSQLGITTNQKTGALDFDSAKFTTAMTTQKLGGEIQTLFLGDPTATGDAAKGLLERMNTMLTPYTVTGSEGILDARSTSLAKVKTNLASQQEALDRRIETLTAVLTKKYNDMDTLVGKLKATASNITSMFDAMNAQKNAS
ncbi:flagellar filament capping protein FliD [Pseudomonas fluorescens]|jgi:flagellar hook-associated protein 2|uniref:Flagellar hook-associated protein 2 n=1 Tax=Pseudomonas fluorescens TaxID=294 RepID=A0A5E7B8T4_PSEFL|nr:flagellar filament capping protein FliD [Pseudomonas fluorescens]VVM47379.1 B-type flagellar hook-associated protein 2 [Pseudomonas fluorescens]VVN88562.1 B-type flagellar hook-associated protein 2 [Pseudomonas fluorescens]